ncbi:MAG TPA: hypothetical protein DCG06_09825, partial [Deltaproteobacteria bacterium]|nr:hypothetical protein [Deltaproteobacteria bacterium]
MVIVQLTAGKSEALTMVAKALALALTWTERLPGNVELKITVVPWITGIVGVGLGVGSGVGVGSAVGVGAGVGVGSAGGVGPAAG